ncbi:Fic family protein [Pedobacter metabolipauper]|uniref:Fic family protein n=1 Tax=Pedobacter metabolipauper TaxID=425513 RepID=A0A4V3D0X3_9SPHI|nr:Fic/DOC family N-terminal domain-containing protein [Pedobacter metabolipauper]TDQ08124.1 Fic family protein [Pedobacter metabolipauper]
MKKLAKLRSDVPFNELPPLPPDQIKVETIPVLRQVVQSSIALSELKGLAYTLPNSSILLNAVILKEARMSSEIENVITTHDKLYQALSASGPQIDHATKEVLRYREAMLTGFKVIVQKGFLNINGVLAIQETLEENKAGLRKLPGTSLKNAITGEVIYTPPDDYDKILTLMKNLEEYINETDVLSPLIKLAVQHYQFESIHPFYDGNGRTGRIINVLYLCLHGLLDSPVLYLSDYIIKHKPDYYRLLGEVKTKGNWEEWILFILKAIEETSKQTTDQIKSINQLFSKLQNKIKEEASKLYNKDLLELLFEQPYCKIEFVIDRLNVSRITASKYLNGLEKIGILHSKKVWKETIYINIELFELLKK